MSRTQRQKTRPAGPELRTAAFPFWKKLLFGLGLAGMILALAEGGLALLGVRVPTYPSDPYVGFARHVPHFVLEEGVGGAGLRVTAENKRRVMNVQRFGVRKPANTVRVFCLGGSTTYGHPYADSTSFCGWLREMLPKADPTRRWELINGGGVSYASYREALLMEELIRYEPDVFILLSAHNEFLEQRSYGSIIAMPETLRGVGVVASRTRLYGAMKSLLERGAAGAARPKAEGVTVLPEDPGAILDRTVGPQSYHRDEVQHGRVVEHYRFNLTRMVRMARSVGARVLLINPASNLRDCSPFKSEHGPGFGPQQNERWREVLREASAARKAGRDEEAIRRMDEALAIDPQHAGLHYNRGQILLELGRVAEAKAALERARDEDVCPLRAQEELLTATAAVAAEQGVPLVDFVRLMEARSANGIPGADWFLDHVHPTIEGHRQLALEIVRVMAGAGWLRLDAGWTSAVELQIKEAVEGRLTARDQASAMVTLAKVLYWAGKNDEAYQAARRAEALAPEDPAVLFEVGKGAARVGQASEALRALRRAVVLNPRFVEARSMLGLQLLEAGLVGEAIEMGQEAARLRPGDPSVRLNLGTMLERAGRRAEAEAAYREAVRLDPGYAEAHNNLGWALKRRGAYTEALLAFREAVRRRPGSIQPTLGLAWLLAAHPDPGQRDAAAAIRLAEALAAQTGQQNWMSLDTLAVAYAGAGRFAEAVRAATQAFAQADRARLPEVTNVATRLELFRNQRPYVEPGRALGVE